MAHKGARNDLTAEYVRSLLDYDPESGVLTWKRTSGCRKIGKSAGWKESNGARRIAIDSSTYLASRLAWVIMNGDWPTGEIDHQNTRKDDNRWVNLRLATSAENNRNRHRMRSNTSGFKGVSWHRQTQKWWVRIMINRKSISLGLFEALDDAKEAYRRASVVLHREFSRVE